MFYLLGIAAGSLAASWKESGGSFFRALQTAAEGGLSSTVAAGLGAALGTAAAVLTLFVKGKKPQPSESKLEDKNEIVDHGEKMEPTKETKEETTCPIVENVTAKAIVQSDVEAKRSTMLETQTAPDLMPSNENIAPYEDIATEVEEQIVHVTFVPHQNQGPNKEETEKYDVKPIVAEEVAQAVEDVVVETVIKLASVFQPEKCEIDEAKTEKSEASTEEISDQLKALPTEAVILAGTTLSTEQPAATLNDDVVHHATKPEEEAKLLIEAVEQLVETEALSEELSGVEECLEKDGDRHISEEIEILSTSEISSPLMNNSVTTSLFQELTEEDIQRASGTNESVSTSLFQELSLEDDRTKPTSETCGMLEQVEHQQTGHVGSIEETSEIVAPVSGNDEALTATVSTVSTGTIQQVADQLINEIESVLLGSDSNSSEHQAFKPEEVTLNEVETSSQILLAVESQKNEDQLPDAVDKKQTSEEDLENVEIAPASRSQAEEKVTELEEDSDEAHEQGNADEEDEIVEDEEDKDNESEKQSKAATVDVLMQNHSKAVEQEQNSIAKIAENPWTNSS